MEKLIFDGGLREYELGRGVLRFNPLDPNVYERFAEATKKLVDLEADMVKDAQAAENNGLTALRKLREADKKAKDILNYVFGGDNDFDYMLSGVNVMAVASNGERVITNLLEALTPILEKGAEDCVASFVQKA